MSPDDWDLVLGSLGPIVAGAVRGTIPLALLSFAGGMVIAVIVALMRLSKRRLFTAAASHRTA